jgi:hypothetical protein
MSFYLAIPGNIESILNIQNNNGNMAIYGVFLDIYLKRNLLYLSLLLFIFFYFLNYFLFGLFIFLFSLCFYLYTCNKWKYVFTIT